jgi:competence protein ComFC
MVLAYTRVMLKIFSNFFDWLFPPPPSVRLISTETSDGILRFYSLGRYQDITYLSLYKEPIISACVVANKFFNNTHGAELLAVLLKNWLKGMGNDKIVLVPVPLSLKRQRERGYNQVRKILDLFNNEYEVKEVLVKVKDTRPQTHLKRLERLTNLSGAFAVKEDLLEESKTYILIDDVVTTGATLRSGKMAIEGTKKTGIKVIAVAITH